LVIGDQRRGTTGRHLLLGERITLAQRAGVAVAFAGVAVVASG
jgi:drug/metabolite transporter (DMT)-like permease